VRMEMVVEFGDEVKKNRAIAGPVLALEPKILFQICVSLLASYLFFTIFLHVILTLVILLPANPS